MGSKWTMRSEPMAAMAELKLGTSKKSTALGFEGYDSTPLRSRQIKPAPGLNLA